MKSWNNSQFLPYSDKKLIVLLYVELVQKKVYPSGPPSITPSHFCCWFKKKNIYYCGSVVQTRNPSNPTLFQACDLKQKFDISYYHSTYTIAYRYVPRFQSFVLNRAQTHPVLMPDLWLVIKWILVLCWMVTRCQCGYAMLLISGTKGVSLNRACLQREQNLFSFVIEWFV